MLNYGHILPSRVCTIECTIKLVQEVDINVEVLLLPKSDTEKYIKL